MKQGDSGESDLAAALAQFDRVGANLEKLERVWGELAEHMPQGIAFGCDTPETDDLMRSFVRIAQHLPAIDGFQITAEPLPLDAIAQMRFDAAEEGLMGLTFAVEDEIGAPGKQLAEYRFRFEKARRGLVRSHVLQIVDAIDALLRDVQAVDGGSEWRGDDRWGELHDLVAELDRLVGNLDRGRARDGRICTGTCASPSRMIYETSWIWTGHPCATTWRRRYTTNGSLCRSMSMILVRS
jgi:hypothetical protein